MFLFRKGFKILLEILLKIHHSENEKHTENLRLSGERFEKMYQTKSGCHKVDHEQPELQRWPLNNSSSQ